MDLSRLYEKYRTELGSLLQENTLTKAQFTQVFGNRLAKMNRAVIDGQGVMHWFVYDEETSQVCVIPAYGWWASSEKILVKLFTQIAAPLVEERSTRFQVHLYAGDLTAQRAFAMLQFGYMAETGILKTPLPLPCHPGVQIRTLGKEEITEKWDEIWSLTGAILDHLKQSPVFYPCAEFQEDGYRDFFLDADTQLHGAFDASGRMVGMIETNAEACAMVSGTTANVGEIYVLPEYRGTSLSDALLAYAAAFARNRGAESLWVEHGTANPNARYFWGKYFESYEYEMDRTIVKTGGNTHGTDD